MHACCSSGPEYSPNCPPGPERAHPLGALTPEGPAVKTRDRPALDTIVITHVRPCQSPPWAPPGGVTIGSHTAVRLRTSVDCFRSLQCPQRQLGRLSGMPGGQGVACVAVASAPSARAAATSRATEWRASTQGVE